MAEGILGETVARLLQDLGSEVFQELKCAKGVKEDIGKLKETMETIQAVLQDAEEKHGQNNHQVKVWLRRLKAAVYDADDLLDDFATERRRQELKPGSKMAKEVRTFFSKSNQFAYNLKMSHKIKNVRKKLDCITNDRRFHLDENPVKRIEREQTYSFVRPEEVIGREGDKNSIIQRLMDSDYVDQNVSIIAIVGLGGLGKTALAQLVYNDEKITNFFQLRMWACVSDDFNVETIIKSIIKSANDKDVERLDKLEADQLQKRLRKEIRGKKYLLILDDVWNENREKWLKLKNLLMNDVKGSMILVTTRCQQVARLTSTLPSHVLRRLNEAESWFLFTKMAFENGIEPKGSNLIQIGKCIVAKCAGVPLAIRTIARLLYYNNMETYWLSFLNDELLKVDQEENDILPKLRLTYNHLSPHLKQCFAYCALFPKDYKIYKFRLIHLWMAQGFLQPSRINRRPEDVGNEYFMDLLSRSFFQDIDYDEWGNLKSCKMHDLMHDLATTVARPECILAKLDATNVEEMTRHISFDSSKLDLSWKIPASLLRANHVRTLFFLGDFHVFDNLNESNINNIITSFRCLRALHCSKCIEKLPNSVGKLKHLRYLDLSCNRHIKELPNSISRLENLQTLKLNGCRSLKKLPGHIGKVVSLRCLMIKNCSSLIGMPHGLRLLTNLQKLSTFVLGRKDSKTAHLNEMEGMNNFKGRLQIERLENATSETMLANIKAKQHLTFLELNWANNDGVSIHDEVVLECLQPHQNLKGLRLIRFGGLRISSWLSTLTNLISLYLRRCEQCVYIPPLDQLPSLETLEIVELCALEFISEKRSNGSFSISTSFFPSLKQIKIHRCHNLKGWWKRDDDSDNDEATIQTAELPSFPCLSKLDIRICPKLTSMPLFPSLKELILRDTSLKPLQQAMMLTNSLATSISSTYSLPTLSKLRSLEIGNCDKFHLLNNVNEKQWEHFACLRSINIFRIPDLVYLPKGLQHVTTLQNLKINDCHLLMILPKGMQLQVLDIHGCPQIKERYGENISVEWPKISHIPNIRFNGHWIQNDGVYQINEKGCSYASKAV